MDTSTLLELSSHLASLAYRNQLTAAKVPDHYSSFERNTYHSAEAEGIQRQLLSDKAIYYEGLGLSVQYRLAIEDIWLLSRKRIICLSEELVKCASRSLLVGMDMKTLRSEHSILTNILHKILLSCLFGVMSLNAGWEVEERFMLLVTYMVESVRKMITAAGSTHHSRSFTREVGCAWSRPTDARKKTKQQFRSDRSVGGMVAAQPDLFQQIKEIILGGDAPPQVDVGQFPKPWHTHGLPSRSVSESDCQTDIHFDLPISPDSLQMDPVKLMLISKKYLFQSTNRLLDLVETCHQRYSSPVDGMFRVPGPDILQMVIGTSGMEWQLSPKRANVATNVSYPTEKKVGIASKHKQKKIRKPRHGRRSSNSCSSSSSSSSSSSASKQSYHPEDRPIENQQMQQSPWRNQARRFSTFSSKMRSTILPPYNVQPFARPLRQQQMPEPRIERMFTYDEAHEGVHPPANERPATVQVSFAPPIGSEEEITYPAPYETEEPQPKPPKWDPILKRFRKDARRRETLVVANPTPPPKGMAFEEGTPHAGTSGYGLPQELVQPEMTLPRSFTPHSVFALANGSEDYPLRQLQGTKGLNNGDDDTFAPRLPEAPLGSVTCIDLGTHLNTSRKGPDENSG